MGILISAASFQGPKAMADNSLKLVVSFDNLTPEKAALLYGLNNQYGYVAIKPEAFVDEEKKAIEGLKLEGPVGKSPSERMRNVLYKIWSNNPQGYADFDNYYVAKMEAMIDHLKKHLPK